MFAACAVSKAQVVQYIRSGVIIGSGMNTWKTGHELTRFQHWETATEVYNTTYEFNCEPYFIAHWDTMPW